MYKSFIDKRIVGNKSIWDTMSKYKLPTFISLNIQVAMKINQELVKLRSSAETDVSVFVGIKNKTGNRPHFLSWWTWAFRGSKVTTISRGCDMSRERQICCHREMSVLDVPWTCGRGPMLARILIIFATYREKNMLFPLLNSDNSEFSNLFWLCRPKHRIVLV